MNKFLISVFIVLSLFCSICYSQNSVSDFASLYSMGVDSVNTVGPRVEFYPFSKIKDFESGDINNSHFYQPLLDGWRYKYYNSSQKFSLDVVKDNYDDSGWDSYQLGSKKLLNKSSMKSVKAKFEPALPDVNPVVVYRNNFKIPMTWDERQMFITFNQLSGASTIYVNGEKVGYNEDSKANCEFDITKFTREGINTLAVVSHAYSVASYLESGDQFASLSIGGDVRVWSAPKVQLRDYIVKTSFDPTFKNGLLEFGAIIRTHYLNPAQVRLFFELRDSTDKVIDSQSKYSKLNMKINDTVYFNTTLLDVKKWSSSEPNLYSVVIKVQREMRYTDIARFNIGFRQVDVRDDKLYINNNPEKIIGLTLQQSDIPSDTTDLRRFFDRVKASGLNALWVVGAQSADFYGFADRLGVYIINSANINSSLTPNNLLYGLSNNRFMVEKYLSRTLNVLEASKSYPSVIAFSLGEDGGNGYNMYESYLALKAMNQNRPIIYQGADREWNTDIFLADNLSYNELKRYKSTTPHPTIIMDFDTKKLDDKWDIIEANEQISGVFFNNTTLLSNSGFASYFAPIESLLIENVIEIQNLKSVDIDGVRATYTLYKRKGAVGTVTFTTSKLAPEEKFTHEIDAKSFKGVRRVEVTYRDNRGNLLLKKSFKTK
ncbi:MAG: glycoside hydrolase family 2 TIM barrel-domain containing protein [Rikenellaceae bacterium]